MHSNKSTWEWIKPYKCVCEWKCFVFFGCLKSNLLLIYFSSWKMNELLLLLFFTMKTVCDRDALSYFYGSFKKESSFRQRSLSNINEHVILQIHRMLTIKITWECSYMRSSLSIDENYAGTKYKSSHIPKQTSQHLDHRVPRH